MAATSKSAEVDVLTAHRAKIGDLQDHPLQRFVSSDRLVRYELSGLLGDIDEDRARLDHSLRSRLWSSEAGRIRSRTNNRRSARIRTRRRTGRRTGGERSSYLDSWIKPARRQRRRQDCHMD